MAGGGSWFGLGFGLGPCRLGCFFCFCGVGGCVGRCWWWCCCWWCDRVGAGLGLGSGFGLGSGSRLRRTSVRRCEGAGAGWGGFPVCCRGAWVACVGVGGAPVALRAAAALALAVALWMRSTGRGGSEDEAEDVDENEDEVEVVVLGDAGCAVMRAVASLWAAASAAATAGRMEGMSWGCRFGVGGWGGRAVTWRPGGPIWSAAAGEGGAGLRSSPSGLGWDGVLQCVGLFGLASAGGNSSRGLHSGARGGGAWVFWGVCGGLVRVTGRGGCAVGHGAPCGGCVRVVVREGW